MNDLANRAFPYGGVLPPGQSPTSAIGWPNSGSGDADFQCYTLEPGPTPSPSTSPSSAPTTASPSTSPTTAQPSTSPTTAQPSTSPTTASPSGTPTRSPSSAPTTGSPLVSQLASRFLETEERDCEFISLIVYCCWLRQSAVQYFWPDWAGDNEGCTSEGTPPQYMIDLGYAHTDLDSCCKEWYSWNGTQIAPLQFPI